MSAKLIDEIIRLICEDQKLDLNVHGFLVNDLVIFHFSRHCHNQSKSPTAFTRWKNANSEDVKDITKDIKGATAKNKAVKVYWENDLKAEERAEYELAHENEKKSRVEKTSEGVPEKEISPDGRVKIKNPDTGKLVYENGPTGKKIVKKMKELESN